MPRVFGMRITLALLLSAVLAFGAVACGSEADSGGNAPSATADQGSPGAQDYLGEIRSAQTDFATDAAGLDLADPSSPRAFKKALDPFVILIDRLTARLGRIEPPAEVTGQHNDLTAQLTEYRDTIERQKDGLGSENQQQVVKSATAIGKASTRFSETFDATIGEINEQLK
jgi:hypothetical protein